ncbi:MAG: ATP-dependent helicase HrpB [Prolixibacteraceae bacterium]
MTIQFQSIDLPVAAVLNEIQVKLQESGTLVVHAPPGAGKSTLVPLALLQQATVNTRKIILLEPRRLAARGIAERMASLLNESVGETVGYRIRFENRISDKTRIEVLTEGILTRMLQSDNSLEGVGTVIFDEFHERSIHADLALALCREVQQVLRPDLRIVIMSATLNLPQLTRLLQAPVVQCPGRHYPVDLVYSGENDLRLIAELTAQVVLRAINEKQGDVLVFLPGEGEIRKCERLLRNEQLDIEVHPLYGSLPKQKQLAAIFPNRNGKRKVILATSIAETSLTIEGVQVVVDSGYARVSRFNPKTGLSHLETIPLSKDSADQRAGRAGRLGPGTCYRMWTRAAQEQLAEHRTPEILEADLASLVLDLAQWGITNPEELNWLNPPPKGAVNQATALLHELEALEDGRITALGKELNRLPCHPRMAHMLVMAKQNGNVSLATDLAAVLGERDPLGPEAGIDINLRMEALRTQRASGRISKKMKRIEKAAESYRNIVGCEPRNDTVNPYETGLLLAYAYPERIAFARPGNNAQFQLSNGNIATAGHKDDLAHETWLAVAHLNARQGIGTIFLASPLNPTDLAPLVKERETVAWDSKKGGLIASKELRIGSIILQSKSLSNPGGEQVLNVISEAIGREGRHLLNFHDGVVQWQNRVLSLRHWNPNDQWPDVSAENLLKTNRDWLTPYLQNVRKTEDLKKIDLEEALHNHLSIGQQQMLDRLAPQKLQVPSGSAITLIYQANGEAPVLAVRLQEIFGMGDTPTINNGRTDVLMHLLSPGFKPVQITSDLKSFWNNAYFEVKKELKRRYPKHAWPDDPWTAEALRGIKRK